MFQPISGGEGGSSEVEASEQRPERSSSSACGTLWGRVFQTEQQA